ncbi:tumor necrosis factor ligand superfamily member 14-like [Eucyclogobius newberryi]|uniref:tumor necrosis factor ligand superfamily member 14-like n=1 Tax=Eucyclogobius newberryi TaxID=166745 RepID=UPI003B59E54B
MAEGSCPQVFVVDQPTIRTQLPIRQKPLWKRARKSLHLPLLGLLMLGLVLEGIFIYRIHKSTEVLFKFHPQLQNPSSPIPPDGKKSGQLGALETNEVPIGTLHPQENTGRPMAHLQGILIVIVGSNTMDVEGVVQWVKGEGFADHMDFNSSGLVIKASGFYYLYSKVHFQETEDCVMVNHRVTKNTTEYGRPIDLMKSKSLHCRNERPNQKNLKQDTDLWNSFLAGVFKLETGDHIFVTLDKGLYPGPADNFFGAFKII